MKLNPFRRASGVSAELDGPAQVGVPFRYVYRNLLLADDGLWAGFVLQAVPWAFQSTDSRAALIDALNVRWADLAGHRVQLRVTGHPVPHNVWAQRLHDRSPDRLPDVEGGELWAQRLTAQQHQVAAAKLESPAVYVLVRVVERRPHPVYVPDLLGDEPLHAADRERMRRAVHRVTASVTRDGFGGRPLSSRGVAWLTSTSIALGIPASMKSLGDATAEWSGHDLEALTSSVRVSAKPYAKTLQVRALRDGQEHVRHVAVLTAGRIEDRDPLRGDFEPWMAYSQKLPYPVEWQMTVDVLHGKDIAASAQGVRQRAQAQDDHYAEHHETPPPAIRRGIADATRIEDEINEGAREVAVRAVGPVRAAVIAGTEDQAMEHADDFIDDYVQHQKITFAHTYDQYELYREFTPCYPPALVGFRRVIPAYFLPTAVPNANTGVGDETGLYLGQVTGSGRRAVMFDPTWGPRNRRPGLCLIQADPGGGKSTLAGVIAEASARRGYRVVIFDPSGPLARLCDLPHLAPFSRHIELDSAEPGTLSPYLLVPDPRREDFTSEAKFAVAWREAEAERVDLMADTILELLPVQMLTGKGSGEVVALVEDVLTGVGGAYGTNPWRVVEAFERTGDQLGRVIAQRLRVASRMKGGVLVFPRDNGPTHTTQLLGNEVLTVITMQGITPPDRDKKREHFTRAERRVAPVLHLASRLAMRAMYQDKKPTVIITDEGGIITGGQSSFVSFLNRGARDSRKHNTCFAILMQNPADRQVLGAQVNNLIGCAFVGRMNREAAADALAGLGVPTGQGYEAALPSLGAGEFLMRDYQGRVERIQVDLDHLPHVLDALRTDPDAHLAVEDDVVEAMYL
ncbi:MAG: ATP-binding protein [Nocardioides sp.]